MEVTEALTPALCTQIPGLALVMSVMFGKSPGLQKSASSSPRGRATAILRRPGLRAQEPTVHMPALWEKPSACQPAA